jgi:hypothetical protein
MLMTLIIDLLFPIGQLRKDIEAHATCPVASDYGRPVSGSEDGLERGW